MTTDEEVNKFLKHMGVSGMKWGVRNSSNKEQAQSAARAKGLGQRQLQREGARVSAAGGGIKGTLKVRQEMLKSGELSPAQAIQGKIKFGRNVTLALLAGGAAGAGIGALLIKNIL